MTTSQTTTPREPGQEFPLKGLVDHCRRQAMTNDLSALKHLRLSPPGQPTKSAKFFSALAKKWTRWAEQLEQLTGNQPAASPEAAGAGKEAA